MPEQTTLLQSAENNFANKICNISQIGGIETSVMDNGYARGTRIAWINTGSGLRFKVVLDRAMDIGDASFNQYGLAWHSPSGIMPPQFFSDKGIGWLRTFGGGLLATCGLSHVGGPEQDEFGERGVHGLISNTPAEIESIIQPSLQADRQEMSITGIIKEARIFGPHLELKRKISSKLGASWIHIDDEITNKGNTTAPHMLLYHFNFGWPLVDEGAELIYDGAMFLMNESRDKKIFNAQNNYRKCPPPLNEHKAAGEAVAYFDVPADADGNCSCGIYNSKIDLTVKLSFRKSQLPWLTNWQHWAPGEYVTGLEPCTHPPIGQAAARKNNSLLFIEPGETKRYSLRLEVIPNRS